MSFQERIDAAFAAIDQHNKELTNEADKIDGAAFVNTLKRMGGTSEDRLSGLSHEDILECFPATMEVKPRLLAKSLAKIFRAKEEIVEEKGKPISAKKADKMTPKELVENFDPEDYTNPVGARLAEIVNSRSKDGRFIVYSSGRIVNVEATHKLLLEIKQGYNGREDYTLPNGDIVKVYAIGDLPDNYVDENPLYVGRPLRPDGTCDQTGRSWEGVTLEVRQLVRVIVKEELISPSLEQAHNILDMVVSGSAFDNLKSRYRRSVIKFSELKKSGNLPKLQVSLTTEGSFPQGKRVNIEKTWPRTARFYDR